MFLAELGRPDYAQAKSKALWLLRKFNLDQPPVDPIDLARRLGIQVYFAEFLEGMQNVSGFYDAEEDSIVVNKDEYSLRQTFTVAHELGHRLLHSDWAKSADYKVLLRDQAANSKDIHEREANVFAAHLLVPRFMLDRYWKSTTVEDLSRIFAVSVSVIRNRISFEYGD